MSFTMYKKYNALTKFFEYIQYTIFPNIKLYIIKDNVPIKTQYDVHSLFTRDNVHEYIWARVKRNKYYALLNLTNGYYMYICGYLDFNTDKFKFYIGNTLDEITPFMSTHTYNRYMDDLKKECNPV